MAFPAPVPFVGKPRRPDGSVVDWVALHLAPPLAAAPWDPVLVEQLPAENRASGVRPRDHGLRHAPHAAAAAPQLLAAGELHDYDRFGFILRPGGGIPVLAPGEVAEQSRLWQAIFEAHCEGDPQGVNGFFKRYSGCYDLVSHPAVVQLARDVLGPRLACWGAHWMCKPAGDALASPLGISDDGTPRHHQDAPGWPFRPAKTATVWVALDPVGPENGPMVVYPKSHLHGKVGCDDGAELAELRRRFGEGVPLHPIRAGHASIHCDMVVHSSPPSSGPNAGRRLAVGIEFVSMDVVTDNGSGWGAQCFVPGGEVTAAEAAAGFGHLARPAVYGPVGCEPPGGAPARL